MIIELTDEQTSILDKAVAEMIERYKASGRPTSRLDVVAELLRAHDTSLPYAEALAAVQDETIKLIARDDLPEDVQERLSLIESICRHGHDVRNQKERG